MQRKEISKLVFKISEGFLSSLTDLVLLNIFFLMESAFIGSPGKAGQIETLVHRDLEKFNYQTIKRVINKAKAKGFINEDLTLTKEGIEKLANCLPQYYERKKWDGNWHLVIYDIPKNKNRARDILRENLKRLGFGQLQASVWISPFNFLGDVQKIVEDYKLSSEVIFAITNKLGKKEVKILAEKTWKLNEINEAYQTILNRARKEDIKELYFYYLNILRKDPQLSKELLPENWAGEEIHKLFAKLMMKS